jgi:oligoribonuclease NrnB/cAMP/cGMP phosphodiesterase (DHH superfamily)
LKCFYHTDEDGKCSAFWVKELAKHYDNYDIEFIPINYGMDFPFDSIRENEQVYIVDYSIFPNEMEKLLEITKDVTWIDHHISAINRYNTPEFSHLHIKGLRYDGIAGCMLTYCYLKHMVKVEQKNGSIVCTPFDISMTEDAPMFTTYIADFDVWKFEYEPTKAFEMGLQLYDLDPNSRVWKSFYYESEIQNIIKDGYLLLDYRDKWSKEYCECTGFDVEFEGYKCFAVNLAMISSDNFKSINEEDYDMFIGFSYNGRSWNYSLRSTKVDCSKIAMKYGGGGHKGASGFSSDRLLF